MTTKNMTVSAVSIRNVLGLASLSIRPGRVTSITGRNGSGKTSILSAIASAIGGGKLANLARIENGVPQLPEVVLTLDDGSASYTVRKTHTRTVVTKDDGHEKSEVKGPQAWLDSIADTGAMNPARFLLADDKERAQLLQDALPLDDFREEDIPVPNDWATLSPASRGGVSPLDYVALIRKDIAAKRTEVNRAAKQYADSAQKLRESIPVDLAGETSESLKAKVDQCEAKRVEILGHMGEIKRLAKEDSLNEIRGYGEEAAEAERIARELFTATVARAKEVRDEKIRASEAKRVQISREAEENYMPKVKALETERDRADGLRRGVAAAEALEKQIVEFRSQAAENESRSDHLSETLDKLDAYKRRLLSGIPVAGLVLDDDGSISVDGVPYDQLNTAKRVTLAVEVSLLRSKGRLPIVFVDGAEALDAEHFVTLCERLTESGAVAFVAAVSDDDLSVEPITDPYEIDGVQVSDPDEIAEVFTPEN